MYKYIELIFAGTYERGSIAVNQRGRAGIIKNLKETSNDGSKIFLLISRNSFLPGSKQPPSKLKTHFTTSSVLNRALSCEKLKILYSTLRHKIKFIVGGWLLTALASKSLPIGCDFKYFTNFSHGPSIIGNMLFIWNGNYTEFSFCFQ